MTQAEWQATTDDWPGMLRALPGIGGSRKLRLWCVAWARAVLAVAAGHPPFVKVAGWFTPTLLAGYAHEVDAAERFADGQLSRRALHAAKTRSGGPWNVFHLPAGHSRLSADRLVPFVAQFAAEFQLPPPGQLAALLRDVFGNPFRPAAFSPAWRTDTVLALAQQMYDTRDFGAMPIMADALQDAGCDNGDVLNHCRGDGPHVRGCWVVDLVLGKE